MANAQPAQSPFLTLRQVADILAVSDKTVRRLIKRGALPHYKFGRQIRFSERDFRDFVTLRRGF